VRRESAQSRPVPMLTQAALRLLHILCVCMASRDLFYHSARQGFVFASSTARYVWKNTLFKASRNLRARARERAAQRRTHTHVFCTDIMHFARLIRAKARLGQSISRAHTLEMQKTRPGDFRPFTGALGVGGHLALHASSGAVPPLFNYPR
jgi:hypothetical protein